MEEILEGKVKEIDPEDHTPALLRKVEEPKDKKKDAQDMVNITGLSIRSKEEISKTMLLQITQARMEEIFEMVRDQVSKAGFDVAMPAGVVVTGGTAQLKDITKFAQGVFGVPARIGYPGGLSGMVEEINDPAYAAVQGLVKHAMEDEGETHSSGSSGFDGFGSIFSKLVSWFKSLLP